MSTKIWTAILVVMFTVSFGESVSARAQETIEQRLARQEAEKTQQTSSTADPHEQLVRARAAKIEAEKAEIEALKNVAKGDTEAMKKARRQLQDEADAENEAKKDRAKNLRNAQLVCADQSDVDNVIIASRAVGSWSFTSSVSIRVLNPYGFPLDIDDERGPVVTKFCSKGSISLLRKRNMAKDGDFTNYFYTARGIAPDGSLWISQPFQFSMSAYDFQSGRSKQNYTWVIQAQKAQVSQ